MATRDELTTDLQSLVIRRTHPAQAAGALRRVVVGSVAAAAALGAVWQARRWSAHEATSSPAQPPTVRAGAEVATATQVPASLTATGFVVPQVVSRVMAKRAAVIQETRIHEGQRVSAGQVLFVLDADETEQQLALSLARARAAALRASAAESSLREQSQRVARDVKLASEGALPTATSDDELARQVTLQNEAAAAGAEHEVAVAQVSLSRLFLRETRVVSPVSGVVLGKPAQPGDMAGTQAAIAQIVDLESLRFEIDVPEAHLTAVALGARCTVILDAYPQRRWAGTVAEVTPAIDRAKATGTVKVVLEDPLGNIFPQMGGRATCAPDPSAGPGGPSSIAPESAPPFGARAPSKAGSR